jgi:hypothetical protein
LAQRLIDARVREAIPLAGGFKGWKALGYPVEPIGLQRGQSRGADPRDS